MRWDPERWHRNEDGSYTRITWPVADKEAKMGVDATEAAIKLAGELGVDLSEIEGSGKDGRITKFDVEAAA